MPLEPALFIPEAVQARCVDLLWVEFWLLVTAGLCVAVWIGQRLLSEWEARHYEVDPDQDD